MSTFSTIYGRLLLIAILTTGQMVSLSGLVAAAPLQENIARYAAEEKAGNKGFIAFSAERGRTLFLSRPATGKPDTPSCTSCHTDTPLAVGLTRAGKEIAPMALSMTPDRYGDDKKLEKWFRRNCKSVLGRVCTPLEKGDFLTFMSTQ